MNVEGIVRDQVQDINDYRLVIYDTVVSVTFIFGAERCNVITALGGWNLTQVKVETLSRFFLEGLRKITNIFSLLGVHASIRMDSIS
jgi:hypothetical protein